jgi:hypothetical protein
VPPSKTMPFRHAGELTFKMGARPLLDLTVRQKWWQGVSAFRCVGFGGPVKSQKGDFGVLNLMAVKPDRRAFVETRIGFASSTLLSRG